MEDFKLGDRKAFVYVRRSQDRADRQVLSIEGQLNEATKLVEQHSLVASYLPAESKSAFKPGRPIFADMMDRIEAGEANHIVTWEAARLARNSIDAGRLLYAFDEGKLISIITPGRTFRNTTEDKFYLQIEFGVSKMYSDRISSAVKRGLMTKYERGEYPGEAPLGYMNVEVGNNRNIAPDPDKGPLVIAAFEYAATGKYTLDAVWRYMRHELGLVSRKGNPLSKQTVFDMLRRPVYTGRFQHGGAWHLGTYQPLITADLFDEVQVAMGWKEKRTRNTSQGNTYPYKGIVVCANCGHNVTAYTKRKRLAGGELVSYTYYTCTRKSKTIKCREPQIRVDELESLLADHLRSLSLTANEAKQCFELVKRFHKEHVQDQSRSLDTWRKEYREAQESLDKLLELRMRDELTTEQYLRFKDRYEVTLKRLGPLLAGSKESAKGWLELAERLFSSAVSVNESFGAANDAERRQLLVEVGSNWQLGNKKVRFTPRQPYFLLQKGVENQDWRARPDSNRRSPP